MNHPELYNAEADIVELVEHVAPIHETFDDEGNATIPTAHDEGRPKTPASAAAAGGDVESVDKDYSISKQQMHIHPWSKGYIGIPINYFSVGLMLGGSVSLLYPVLVVHEGVTSTFLAASTSIVTIFWSYKIVFGFLSDCFPIFGYKRKPYIICGWILCATVLLTLASKGDSITPQHLVLVLTVANLGYVMSDVAADGFMVWIAHREPIEKRGMIQTLIYASNKFGQICINFVILFGFSGPHMNCPGYEPDPTVPCTTDPHITSRNDLFQQYPANAWCHLICPNATFNFDMTISQFAYIIATVNILSLISYWWLNEEKAPRERNFLHKFWSQLQHRALWQVILYSMVSHITFGVINAAKVPANYVWLNLHTTQYQIMIIMEKTIFFVGLNVIRRYALNMSWRKMIICGSLVVTTFNCIYFIIVFNIWREAWFYIFTDVSEKFIHTLNFVASVFCMVEVAEPGFESITYALITTASNSVSPLSSVVSYQLLAFFPLLHTQQSIAQDTWEVRMEFATLQLIVILINVSSLLCLPMLPRQKKETRDLVARKESSAFWGRFTVVTALLFLTYSTIVTFITVAASDVYGCFKILGGSGCSAEESDTPAHMLVAGVLLFCYGINFWHTFLPILMNKKKFSWSMFV